MSSRESRLTRLTRDAAAGETLELWDAISGGRGSRVVDSAGRMSGPFNVWLQSPQVGHHLLGLGGSLREDSELDRGLNELAVCTTTAYWRSNYPFVAHAAMAKQFGVPDSILEALVDDERPNFSDERQEVVYDVVRSVVSSTTLDDELYERASGFFNDRELVEIVLLAGWYTLTAFAVNTFHVPIQEGQTPLWQTTP